MMNDFRSLMLRTSANAAACIFCLITALKTTNALQLSSQPVRSAATPSPATKVVLPNANDVSIWNDLLPPLWKRGVGFDRTVEWSSEDDIRQVACHLLQDQNTSDRRVAIISSAMATFQNHCHQYLRTPQQRFKTRIVATRGPSGTKCPQWHLDHVPVRWIHSLAGRGCQYVDVPSSNNDHQQQHGINWTEFNSDDDEEDSDYSMENRNQQLVDPKVAPIIQAAESEAMLLVGNRWNEFVRDTTTMTMDPVVHKSPGSIAPWEGRVLLTQDILVD